MPRAYAKDPDTGDLFPVNSIHVFSNAYSPWKYIADLVKRGEAEKYLRVGDTINAMWVSPTIPGLNLIVPWIIVAMKDVITPRGETKPAIIVQAMRTLSVDQNVVFDAAEPLYIAREKPLSPGTYHVVMKENWGRDNPAGTSWSFTLTKEVPAGGVLSGFFTHPSNGYTRDHVITKTSANGAQIERVPIAKSSVGTNLGYLSENGDGNLNGLTNIRAGSNNWEQSYVRQWLNNKGPAAGWWKPQSAFDVPGGNFSINQGYMTGWAKDFLEAIKPFKSVTALNSEHGGDRLIETFDTFSLPAREELYITPKKAGEGPALPYWKNKIGTDAPVDEYDDVPALTFQNMNRYNSKVWTRSADIGGVFTVLDGVSNGPADSFLGVAPIAAIY